MTISRKSKPALIVFERAEGPVRQCVEYECLSWEVVEALITNMRANLDDNEVGYYKCDFKVVWPDGEEYKGRYDLSHKNKETLGQHIREHLLFIGGFKKPIGWTDAQYAQWTLGGDNGHITKFLDTHDLGLDIGLV